MIDSIRLENALLAARLNVTDGTLKAIIDRTDDQRLQVDFGKDETALIHLWQVVEKIDLHCFFLVVADKAVEISFLTTSMQPTS